jgi:CheY-like chemotaxis protein
MLILYAEDDSEDVEVFLEALKSIDASIACIVARDGAEAIDLLENSVVLPDYIFLDVNMPVVGGRECLMRIRKNENLANTPVIMYTTSTRKNDMVEFRDLGATDYVVKPNTFSELLRFLTQILRSK